MIHNMIRFEVDSGCGWVKCVSCAGTLLGAEGEAII